MGVQRLNQINELIRSVLAEVVERNLEFPTGVLVTIKRVVTSRDLSTAKVWVSVLPAADAPAALKNLQRALPDLQRQVASRVILQFMPKLRLLLDESEERAQRVTKLLDALKKEESGERQI